ncbi:MAG TPA: S8 family serine peptidase [Oligoflexus sp.]|uniref:S8 family peptidase n=1 Tax=Oligoflexus sp. TaxID=1971216 RepID=UPI002D30F431|nr:S8 family serine peptidase [Oligoflexus sp.]HYX31904.1 S8 family serine peptidase [Oligoflexus sp.]
MKSRSTRALQPLWVMIAILGCAKAPQKLKLDYPHKDNELILTMRAGETLNADALLRSYSSAKIEVLNERSVVLRFPEGETVDLEAIAQDMAADRRVQAVEANLIYRLDERIPNDPDFSKLYGLRNEGGAGGVAGADLGMTKAWDYTTGSASVLIGIIDSGTDYTHPDLTDNIWKNPGETGVDSTGQDRSTNGRDDDGNGYVDDWHGWDFFNNDNNPMDDNSHGTHVAGTIGGRGNNSRGVVGVNWQVSMVPIKVFSGTGESSADVLIKGIDYATALGVVATNNSWGGGAFSDAMVAAIERAKTKGILFIAASGNNGSNNDAVAHYPSSYDLPNIIAVAATDRKDALASFSNYGVKSVHVAAPGNDIWSTVPNGSYGLKSGTSMATPHVTGLVALLKARYPQLKAQALKNRIIGSTQLVPQIQTTVKFGRISAASALEDDTVAPAAVQDISILETGIKDLRLTWKEAGDDGDVGQASRYQVRMAAEPILDDNAWDAATSIVVSEIVQNEGMVTGRITGLDYNQTAYIAVRALDNVGNMSATSGSTSFTLKPVRVLLTDDAANNANWLRLDAPWSFMVQNAVSYLMDSAVGSYQNNVNVSAETVDFTFNDSDLILDVKTRHQLEAGYDFGYIELSKDQGQTWIELKKLSGPSDWTTMSISLKDALNGASVFRIRFRLKTDYSITYDGWDIDSFQVVGRQL